MRLSSNGKFDDSFGLGGIQTVQLSVPPDANYNQQANSVVIAADGGILLGGPAATTMNGAPYAIGIAKLVGDGIFADPFGD